MSSISEFAGIDRCLKSERIAECLRLAFRPFACAALCLCFCLGTHCAFADQAEAQANQFDLLGEDLADQGRFEEAVAMYQKALKLKEDRLGLSNIGLAPELNDLAIAYRHLGRLAQAEQAYRRALQIVLDAGGPADGRAALLRSNLAIVLEEAGRYAEAEDLYRQALSALSVPGPSGSAASETYARTLNSLGWLYKEQGRYDEAEEDFKKSMAMHESLFGHESVQVAENLNNLGTVNEERGAYPEAEDLFKQALDVYEHVAGPDNPDRDAPLGNLAHAFMMEARYDEAVPLLEQSLAQRRKSLPPEHPDIARALNNLAGAYSNTGRMDEAGRDYEAALKIYRATLGDDHPEVARVMNNLASVDGVLGRYGDKEALLRQALAIFEKSFGPEHPEVGRTCNNLGTVLMDQHRPAEAEAFFQRAVAILTASLGQDNPALAVGRDNLARLYQEQNDLERALDQSRVAVGSLRSHFNLLSGARTLGGLAEKGQDRGIFLRLVWLTDAVSSKHPDRAAALTEEGFATAQLAQISRAGQALTSMAVRFGAGSDDLARSVRERQDLVERWRRLDDGLVAAVSQPPKLRDAKAEAESRRKMGEIDRQLVDLDSRIRKQYPHYAELSDPQPLTAAETGNPLNGDEALLLFLVGQDESWLWVVRQRQVFELRLQVGGGRLREEVAALRASLDPASNRYRADSSPPLASFPALRSYRLYKLLLGSAAPFLRGANHLFIIPDGALEELPLGVLVTEAPAADPRTLADHRAIRWLGTRTAITVLPTVSSLKQLRGIAGHSSAARPFLGIGDPGVEGPSTSLVAAFHGQQRASVADAVRTLQPIPETAGELKAIADALGAGDDDLVLRDRARKPRVTRLALEQYRLVAFATHGLRKGELPGLGEPALILTPPPRGDPGSEDDNGLLKASEVATLKFDADWVVLSACNTAAGSGSPDAGGLSGLGRAFLYAGARSLLVSHWSVPSDAAVHLTTAAFRAYAQAPDLGRAEALRKSMVAIMDASMPDRFAHPQSWAPFVVVGDGGARR